MGKVQGHFRGSAPECHLAILRAQMHALREQVQQSHLSSSLLALNGPLHEGQSHEALGLCCGGTASNDATANQSRMQGQPSEVQLQIPNNRQREGLYLSSSLLTLDGPPHEGQSHEALCLRCGGTPGDDATAERSSGQGQPSLAQLQTPDKRRHESSHLSSSLLALDGPLHEGQSHAALGLRCGGTAIDDATAERSSVQGQPSLAQLQTPDKRRHESSHLSSSLLALDGPPHEGQSHEALCLRCGGTPGDDATAERSSGQGQPSLAQLQTPDKRRHESSHLSSSLLALDGPLHEGQSHAALGLRCGGTAIDDATADQSRMQGQPSEMQLQTPNKRHR